METKRVNIDSIVVPDNVRQLSDENDLSQLMQSMRDEGLLEPIKVCKVGGVIKLVFGSRRLEAATKLGWKTIEAIYEEKEMSDKDILIENTIENEQRKDITEAELGRRMDNLMQQYKMTASEVASRLSLAKSRVDSALLCYRELPERIRKMVVHMNSGGRKKGKIPATTAVKVLQIDRKFRIGREKLAELLERSRQDGFGNANLEVLMSLLKSGMNIDEAIKNSDKIELIRTFIPVIRGELEEKMKARKMKGKFRYVMGIVYGEIKDKLTNPIKRKVGRPRKIE